MVTFNREVTIIGDGTTEPEIVTGDKLQNQQVLEEIGKKHTIQTPISKSSKDLLKKLFALEETGPTALGPAMLISVVMAAKQKGSRVVVCTDGLANVGLGALDKLTPDARASAVKWYEQVGDFAKQNGVMVSVISLIGEECSLEDLGRVVDRSGGDIKRVNPVDLLSNFKSVLEKPTIATNVNATLILHQGLAFRNEVANEQLSQASKLVKDIGNVTEGWFLVVFLVLV